MAVFPGSLLFLSQYNVLRKHATGLHGCSLSQYIVLRKYTTGAHTCLVSQYMYCETTHLPRLGPPGANPHTRLFPSADTETHGNAISACFLRAGAPRARKGPEPASAKPGCGQIPRVWTNILFRNTCIAKLHIWQATWPLYPP